MSDQGGGSVDSCSGCVRNREFDTLPPRELIVADEHWRVCHAYDSSMLGWLILVARRHVKEIAELTTEEATALGVWQVRLAQALAAELGTPKVYSSSYGEMPGFHLHFHIVARAVDLDPSLRVPRSFGMLAGDGTGPTEAERDAFSLRLREQLA